MQRRFRGIGHSPCMLGRYDTGSNLSHFAYPPHIPNTVNFTPENSDTILRNSEFSGNDNSKVGIFSCWMRLAGLPSVRYEFFRVNTNKVEFTIDPSGVLTFILRNAANATAIDMDSSTSLSTGSWQHILASWNAGAGTGKIYINDVDRTTFNATNNFSIDYTNPPYRIGGFNAFTPLSYFCLADFYLNNDAYMDLTLDSNRRKFISGSGNPVYLGVNGEFPTGSAPMIFLDQAGTSFIDNSGYGGDFTVESGSLTECPTDPLD